MIVLYALTVLVGVISPICIKEVVTNGYSYLDVVFWRSAIVLIVLVPSLIAKRESWETFKEPISLIRVIVGGIILTLTTFSYKYLSATDVNTFSRLDLPFFLLLFGSKDGRFMPISVLVMAFVYAALPMHSESYAGMIAIWIAAFLTAISYWLIRKVAKKRNLFELVAPPYFGALIVSFVILGRIPAIPDIYSLLMILASALCAIALYVLTSAIFIRSKIGAAELTGCAALLFTFVVEKLVLGRNIPMIVGTSALTMGFVCWLIIYQGEIKAWIQKRS